MEILETILPEIFLSISIMFLLLFGVFKNNSYKIVYKLTILILFFSILLVLNQVDKNFLIFNDSFIVDGSIAIYDLEEETDIEFPEDRDYDTLGGFILDILTDIPQTGEQVKFNDMVFTVQTVENNRICKIKIQIFFYIFTCKHS